MVMVWDWLVGVVREEEDEVRDVVGARDSV